MNKPRSLFLALTLAITAGPTYAQDVAEREPPKWGEIPQEHLEMDHYAADSNAAAVILVDDGHLYFEDDLDMVFERHTRIKILTEAGYDWGTVTIPYVAEGRTQRVHGIKGQTYYAAEGGRVETHEMEKGSVFDEDVDGTWKRIRFTLPSLKPGSVIEYRYRVVSTDPRYFPDWAFQKSEPVLWSEYRAEIPEILRYVTIYQGGLEPDVAEQESYSRMMHWTINLTSENAISTSRRMARASTQVYGVKYRWVMRDVPALRREPFMTTPEDFRAKIRFELAEIGHPSTPIVKLTVQNETFEVPVTQLPVRRVMTSWVQLAGKLMESKWFGKQIGDHRAVREQAHAIVGGLTDPHQKMQVLYDFVRTTMVWTGQRGVLVDQDLDDALTTRTGDSPEITLLLLSMLREAGLDAHPVLISTRSHGRVAIRYPLLSQFNDVLAYVEIGEAGYLLDAKDPLRPYTLLPEEALNDRGFLVRYPGPEWFTIVATEQFWHQRFLNVALDTSGTLTGRIQASDAGYSALEVRRALKEADTPEAFAQDILLDGIDGAQVDSCTVTSEEAVTEELKTEAHFSASAYGQVAGDFIYFNPMPLGRLRENPLRLPERTFPVDLAYPRTQIYNLALELPEGYTVHETPRNVRLLLPEDGGMYQRLLQVDGNVLLAQSQIVIKQAVFEPEHYAYIRSFFEQIVAAEAEQVVLKRVTEPE